MIYLDNAATTLKKPEAVYLKADEAFRTLAANAGRGSHQAAMQAAEAIYEARSDIASFFGISEPERMIFTAGCTDSLNLVLFGLFSPGDHVITTVYEHNAVLRPLYELNKRNVTFSIAEPDETGHIFPHELEKHLTKATKAVVINAVSNVTGHRQDLNAISAFCKKNHLLLIVDGAQAAGHGEVNGWDYLCCAGHKGLLGPQGIGLLLMAPDAPMPRPLRLGGTGSRSLLHEQPEDLPEALESGTLNVPGICALAEGVKFVRKHRDAINKQELAMNKRLTEGLRGISGVTLYSPVLPESGVAAFTVSGHPSGRVADRLNREYGICARGGYHCAPLVHRYYGTLDGGMVRFSVSYDTKESDIDEALRAIREIAGK